MPLVTTEAMLLAAQAGHYAVGAFNVENMEMVQAAILAAQECRSPVILQTTPGTLKYAPPSLFFAMAADTAKGATVPVAIHLDHGESFAQASTAFRDGYTSIMIDGSKLSLDGNIALTKSVVQLCNPSRVPVEGELGKVGGKEDDLVGDGVGYTDPQEAVRFVNETGISSLAVGIGTAHGVYATEPVLNIPLVSVLRDRVSVPLVLHGASGLSEAAVRACIAGGICKVNYATELRIAYTNAIRRYLQEDPKCIDPKKFGAPGKKAVQSLVMEKMMLCGCAGKA